MSKLLRAAFARMVHTKLLWIMSALFAGFALMMCYAMVPSCVVSTDGSHNFFEAPADAALFVFVLLLGFALAIICSLFVGTEYSDGTMRNKLVIGQSRAAVYLSNLIVCVAAGWFLIAVYVAVYLAVAVPLFGAFQMQPKQILFYSVAALCLVLAYASCFVLIAMLRTSKAVSAVICLVISLLSFCISAAVEARLEEPEFYSAYSMTIDGVTQSEEQMVNTNFLRGKKRAVYEMLDDCLPGCQASRLTGNGDAPEVQFIWYSLAWMVVLTAAGLVVFRKKDIK